MFLRKRCAKLKLVWIMGADNLAQFHRWESWQAIADEIPMAIIDRPPASLQALASPAAQSLAGSRLPESKSGSLADHEAPAWVFLTGLKSPLSSTRLRNADGTWKRT